MAEAFDKWGTKTTEEDNAEDEDFKKRRPRSATDIARAKVERLMKNPEKPVFLPSKPKTDKALEKASKT